MAVLEGGIFSRPRGKTGGVVFGAARTRTGKQVTSRLLVPPSNPNTAAQQTQRSIFSAALNIVRNIGANYYQDDFNRAISQLPGFQSLMSYTMNALNSSLVLDYSTPLNLGSLHTPSTASAATGTNFGEIDLTWNTDNGLNGTANDELVYIAVPKAEASRTGAFVHKAVGSAVRSDGAYTIEDLGGGTEYEVLVYFKGAGTADGLISGLTPTEAEAKF